MPVLRFLGFLIHLKCVFKAFQFFFELNYETYLCGNTEIADYKEADGLKKAVSVQFLFISSQPDQVF